MNNNIQNNNSLEKNKINNNQIPKINILNNINESKINNSSNIIENSNEQNNDNNEIKNDDEEIKKSEILQNLNKIFLNNSQYNNKEKDYFMNRFQIIDILKKSNIISKKIISKTQADLILTKLYPHKRKYNLIDFMNFLTELCHYIYKDIFESNPKETMNYFLNCFFNNYNGILEEKNSHNFIEKINDNSCTIKCIETIITSKLDKPIFKLLLSLYDSFKKIYKVYFPNELIKNLNSINHEIIMLNSSENLFQFSKDFEIIPYIISKSNLNTYYNFLIKYQTENPEIINEIMNNSDKKYKDMGICFKLSSFILFVYHYSIFLYYKDFKTQYIEDINNYEYETSDDVDRIIFFLQRLENSNGIKKYLGKRYRTNDNKFTFIPSDKNIEIANEEMRKEKNEKILSKDKNIKNNNIDNSKLNNKKYNIESSPYTSSEITERKIENNNNSDFKAKTDKSMTPNKEILIRNNNFNNYFIEKTKKDNDYLSLSELKKILSVSPSIKNVIINNLEKLSEIFLQYSKIHNKLEYNRMTVSSYLQFLKDTNILYVIPNDKKNNFRKLSDKLIMRNYNISKLKKFDQTLRYSVSCGNIPLSKEEKKYKKNISQLVNINSFKEKGDKINIGEASLIFFSLTSLNNFPSYSNKIKTFFDKNGGNTNIDMDCYMQKTLSFDTKRDTFIQKNIPNEMNFVLFLKSFELISTRLYPEMTLDDAMANLLNKKILPFIKERKINIINSDEMKDALAKMNNSNIKNFLIKLADVIYPLYNIFSDQKGNMKFYQFFDFYKYFDIFPELISLSQMKAIFFTLCESSSVNLENNNKSYQKKIDQIDFSLFLESLGISSMFFNFKDIVSDIDRLLYICYIIWKSDGIKKQKIQQNIPQKINNNFIEFLKKYNRGEIDTNNTGNDNICSSERKNIEPKRIDFNYNKNNSNSNIKGKKLVLSYNNFDNEYNCTVSNREVYKFDDIYK